MQHFPFLIPLRKWGGSSSNLRCVGGNRAVQPAFSTAVAPSLAHLCMEEISHEGLVSHRFALRGRNVRHHPCHTPDHLDASLLGAETPFNKFLNESYS